MSYRSIKRVLGETSLERKCRFLFGACLLLLITASFWWYGFQTEKIVNETEPEHGPLLVDQEMHVRHWQGVAREATRVSRNWRRTLGKTLHKQKYEWRFILPNLPVTKDGEPDGSAPRRVRTGRPPTFPEEQARARPRADAGRVSPSGSVRRRQQVLLLPADPRRQTVPRSAISHRATSPATRLSHRRSRGWQFRRPSEGDLMAVAKLTFSTEATRKTHQQEPRHPHRHRHHHRLPGDGRLLRHRPLRDRQAAAAPARRERRHQPRQHRPAGRHPHRRRVRGAGRRLQPHVAPPDHRPGGTPPGQRQPRRQGRRTGPGQHAALRIEHAQERLPGHHEPRAAHAAEQHPRLQRGARLDRRLGRQAEALRAEHPEVGQDAAGDDQRHPRPGQDRERQDGDAADRLPHRPGGRRPVRHGPAADGAEEHRPGDAASTPELPPMHQDQARVQQILNNLLSNAIKFTPEGGRITVAVPAATSRTSWCLR